MAIVYKIFKWHTQHIWYNHHVITIKWRLRAHVCSSFWQLTCPHFRKLKPKMPCVPWNPVEHMVNSDVFRQPNLPPTLTCMYPLTVFTQSSIIIGSVTEKFHVTVEVVILKVLGTSGNKTCASTRGHEQLINCNTTITVGSGSHAIRSFKCSSFRIPEPRRANTMMVWVIGSNTT